MSAKHTPGPWATKVESGSIHVFHQYPDGSGGGGRGHAVVHDPFKWERAKANAALIAAAPELLEALETLFDAYQRVATSDDWDIDVGRLATSAIAKAKGENPSNTPN